MPKAEKKGKAAATPRRSKRQGVAPLRLGEDSAAFEQRTAALEGEGGEEFRWEFEEEFVDSDESDDEGPPAKRQKAASGKSARSAAGSSKAVEVKRPRKPPVKTFDYPALASNSKLRVLLRECDQVHSVKRSNISHLDATLRTGRKLQGGERRLEACKDELPSGYAPPQQIATESPVLKSDAERTAALRFAQEVTQPLSAGVAPYGRENHVLRAARELAKADLGAEMEPGPGLCTQRLYFVTQRGLASAKDKDLPEDVRAEDLLPLKVMLARLYAALRAGRSSLSTRLRLSRPRSSPLPPLHTPHDHLLDRRTRTAGRLVQVILRHIEGGARTTVSFHIDIERGLIALQDHDRCRRANPKRGLVEDARLLFASRFRLEPKPQGLPVRTRV